MGSVRGMFINFFRFDSLYHLFLTELGQKIDVEMNIVVLQIATGHYKKSRCKSGPPLKPLMTSGLTSVLQPKTIREFALNWFIRFINEEGVKKHQLLFC